MHIRSKFFADIRTMYSVSLYIPKLADVSNLAITFMNF